MADEVQSIDVLKAQEAERVRTCDHCGGMAVIARTLLSIYTGKTVRMFVCSCGQRSWLDE